MDSYLFSRSVPFPLHCSIRGKNTLRKGLHSVLGEIPFAMPEASLRAKGRFRSPPGKEPQRPLPGNRILPAKRGDGDDVTGR